MNYSRKMNYLQTHLEEEKKAFYESLLSEDLISMLKEQGENKDKVQKESTETRSPKRVFGLYENVLLTEAERSEFERRYSDAESRIDRLSTYLRETGKRYSDHYAVLCRWAKEDGKRPQRTPCGGFHRGNLHLDEAEKRTYDIAAFDEMDFTNTLDFTGNTS